MFIVTAFVMGLLVALNPCQIAINLSALTFIEQRVSTSRQRQLDCLIYTLGKALAYTLLGFAVSMAAYYGKAGSESWLNRHGDIFSTVETIIPFILAAAGIYMFYRHSTTMTTTENHAIIPDVSCVLLSVPHLPWDSCLPSHSARKA